jgi:hypothetical protein
MVKSQQKVAQRKIVNIFRTVCVLEEINTRHGPDINKKR